MESKPERPAVYRLYFIDSDECEAQTEGPMLFRDAVTQLLAERNLEIRQVISAHLLTKSMVKKKDRIAEMLSEIYERIGCDTPKNNERILQFVFEDVCETADPRDWTSGDVEIAFRRYLEQKDS